MGTTPCEFCDETAAIDTRAGADEHGFDCPACGKYSVSARWREAKMKSTLGSDDLVQLRGVIRDDTDDHGACRETITPDSFRKVMTRARPARTPVEQMDRALEIIALKSPFVGAAIDLGGYATVARRLYLREDGWALTMLKALKGMGFISIAAESAAAITCSLTLSGWERVERQRKTIQSGDQAFVAMWFHPEMDAVFDDGIKPALLACGYSIPYRIDRTAHQNKIDDEIVANIRRSRLLVADLTGIRPNVFYEAGFAMGLGVPVIFTCAAAHGGHFVAPSPNQADVPDVISRRWFDQISDHAFDVRQYPTIAWADPAALAKALQHKIEALGLSRVPGA